MSEDQSRWKSWVLWSAVSGQLISLLQLTGVFARMGLDAGYVGDVIALILGLLVTVGVINNPTNESRW